MKQQIFEHTEETTAVAFRVAPQVWSLPAQQWEDTSEMSMLTSAFSEDWYFGTPCCVSVI